MSTQFEDDGFPRVWRGERAVLTGRTGSGKTTLARWLLRRSPGSWIILNSKHDESFAEYLPSSITINSLDHDAINEAFVENRFVIINPPKELSTPEIFDAFIESIHDDYERVGVYIDELYHVHNNGRAGPGLTGILTRGRSLQQSFIGSTQRPAWVSKFIFSEANYYGVMTLNLKDDRKRIYEFVGDESVLENPPEPRQWRWYEVESDTLRLLDPVQFD